MFEVTFIVLLYAETKLHEGDIDLVVADFMAAIGTDIKLIHTVSAVNRSVFIGTKEHGGVSCTVIKLYVTMDLPKLMNDTWPIINLIWRPWQRDIIASQGMVNQSVTHTIRKIFHVPDYIFVDDIWSDTDLRMNEWINRLNRTIRYEIKTVNRGHSRIGGYPDCPMVRLNDEEYIMQGSLLRLTLHELDVSSDLFLLTETGDVFVCADILKNSENGDQSSTDRFRFVERVVAYVCLSVSILCLLISLITFCRFSQLRNTPGTITMHIICCLLLAQLTFLCSSHVSDYPLACSTLGIFLHYMYLCYAMWTSVATLHMVRVFRNPSVPGIKRFGSRTLIAYNVCGYGIPSIVVGTSVIMDVLNWGPIQAQYGQKDCFISSPLALTMLFAAPVGLVLLTNGVLFAMIIHSIQRVPQMETASGQSRSNVVIYARMSCLMGFTWVFGFAATFTDLDVLWLLFIVFNSLQGLFIFLATVCTGRIIDLWRLSFGFTIQTHVVDTH